METISNENAALYFVDRHIDEGRSDKIAFREADGEKRTLTYGELAHDTARFAGALSRHGVRREERVAMIVRDQIEFPTVFWGAIKAGTIPVPMNTLLATDIYAAMLEDCRASILVVSKALWETVKPATQGNQFLRTVVVIGDAVEGTESYDVFVKNAPLENAVVASDDELAFWLYSSGSTGKPKGVRHVHSSLKATCDTFGSQILGLREDDVIYSVAKLFFAYGMGNGMSFPLAFGASAILLSGRPTPEIAAAILKDLQPTILCGVPTHFSAMVYDQEKSGVTPDHNLRLCTSAGEALPREIGEAWERIWKTEIVDGVGSTEMLHIFLSNSPGHCVYGTSGLPVPGYDVRLVDENDNDIADGDVGELLVHGPSSAEGYWNRRHKSMSTFSGFWTRTGDKYERNAEGRYIYCGRADDMFKVSGIWLSPFEVEQALIEHPDVLEAAVVARKNEEGLEKAAAYIILKDSADPSIVVELKEFVKEKIGLWKYPRWIDVVEELPKTATGKIQRFKLRDLANGGET